MIGRFNSRALIKPTPKVSSRAPETRIFLPRDQRPNGVGREVHTSHRHVAISSLRPPSARSLLGDTLHRGATINWARAGAESASAFTHRELRMILGICADDSNLADLETNIVVPQPHRDGRADPTWNMCGCGQGRLIPFLLERLERHWDTPRCSHHSPARRIRVRGGLLRRSPGGRRRLPLAHLEPAGRQVRTGFKIRDEWLHGSARRALCRVRRYLAPEGKVRNNAAARRWDSQRSGSRATAGI